MTISGRPRPTVILTRHYSGFANRADSYAIGDHEHDGDAAADTYVLPDGYRLDHSADRIRDPDGYECAIIATPHGPKLMSMVGQRPDVMLARAAGVDQ